MKFTKLNIAIIIALVILISVAIYFYIKYKKPVKSILFIGDSNTAANFSYADKLKQMYPGLVIKKIAMNGAKTDWMLQQLKVELNLNKYDAVAILGGSNDIYALANIKNAILNLDAMYKLAKSKGSRVLAVTPPNKDYYINRTDQKQTLLNNLVSWIRLNINVTWYIDFHKMTANKSFFSSGDGFLHPGSAAHKILADSVAQKLNLG
jgi:hypothetical protein